MAKEHEMVGPCQEHSGVTKSLETLANGQTEITKAMNRIWDSLNKLSERWPLGATITVSILTFFIGALIGVFGMYIKTGG